METIFVAGLSMICWTWQIHVSAWYSLGCPRVLESDYFSNSVHVFAHPCYGTKSPLFNGLNCSLARIKMLMWICVKTKTSWVLNTWKKINLTSKKDTTMESVCNPRSKTSPAIRLAIGSSHLPNLKSTYKSSTTPSINCINIVFWNTTTHAEAYKTKVPYCTFDLQQEFCYEQV